MMSLFLAYQEVLNGAELENLCLSESTKDNIRKFRPFETLTGALYSDVAQNAGLKKQQLEDYQRCTWLTKTIKQWLERMGYT